jgi:serine phosphatase RsbU (regulator of sigma subunit)
MHHPGGPAGGRPEPVGGPPQPAATQKATPKGSLADRERLEALQRTGLSAVADVGMDRFARLVAGRLGVPVALISLVEAGRQVFPGQVGLGEPWATGRQTPLSHSLCQHVVTSGRALVLSDVRRDERTRTSLAIDDLGVVAYAGMPLTDSDGYPLGSLCAIDTEPRSWSEQELADLADLAAACSAELRLRIVSEQARVALARAELMLRAAEDLADTLGLDDVRRRVRDLFTGDRKPAYVGQPAYIGLALLEDDRLLRVPDPQNTHPVDTFAPAVPVGDAWPSARAAREGRLVVVADRADLRANYGPEAIAAFDRPGLEAAVCLPLRGTRRILGTLILGWDVRHHVDVSERAVLTAIAGYAAQAVERATYLDERISVAHRLQQAMLTDLPRHPGLELAAFYRPAGRDELVGGDWYDAYLLSLTDGPPGVAGTDASRIPLAVTVGDITGHDMNAAATMGQIRSMLRQSDADHEGGGPAQALAAMERACHILPLDATGTLVHAHLRPASPASSAEAGSWDLTWTNAGHPPPLVVDRGGRAERLDQHQVLLWPGMKNYVRVDQRRVLTPGSVLLLYTDGLVERRKQPIDLAIDRLSGMLADVAGLPLPELLAAVVDRIAGPASDDDIALLAVRIPG